ncbi:Alkaline phosphatase [Phytophthora megakarya]|uniref:Alkaline phosphatase n=1 Tax=Phytophthora megakarya TaxID=4795 RepID=A0A225V9J6_9STRA|nr:Alkaline phosphatase [Phytophthora megakarya]
MLSIVRVATICSAVATALISADPHYEYKTVDVDYNFDENEEMPRSLIMMIPDGTGPNVFTLARTVLDPSLKTRLHIDPYVMGTIQTHSSTSYITDSAAAATAYSTGFKTYDNAIAVDTFEQPLGTVLEAAKARGMVTGMIVTCRVTHATPASFATHVVDRDSEDDIAAQYVANKNLDFLLGGGKKHFNDSMIEDLKTSGYTVVNNYQDLLDYQNANADSGALRLFGLFKDSHMTYEVDRLRQVAGNDTTAREPSLPEMVDIVLDLLRKNEQAKKHGYFVMIEGSRVDHAGHSNDPGTMAKEAIAFDEAVAVVLDHVEQTPNTAMLSAADHGTGGLTLGRSGMEYPYPWYPTQLQQQNMSTEVMQERLDEILAGDECALGANETCKMVLLETAKMMLTNYTNVTSVTDEVVATLVTEIGTAVDETRDLYFVLIELGHIISNPAWIGWTTVGHVGTDVNLYCKGPLIFERMCKGVHENVYLNKLMTTFLGLEHQQDLETMKHRNISVLEEPLVAELPPPQTW